MQESRTITRQSASNLALAFVLLPKPKRDGMSALYAFCRQVDDIADDESRPVETRRRELAEWRADIREACAGGSPRYTVNQELQPVIRQYGLSCGPFEELITGVEMDLDQKRYETYEALEVYCYRVASVVGLLSIEIFGYRELACREYAVYLGKALQFTNILRDVGSDAERGRLYLPGAEMARFGVSAEEILRKEYSSRFVQLAESVAARARHFYTSARLALPAADRRSMIAAELMGSVYWRLLRKLERERFNVFNPPPTRLSRPHKLLLIAEAWFRISLGAGSPVYGT
jgi:15-cis-phytoene synthase